MKFLLGFASACSFAVGALAILASKSDIQIGIAVTAIIGGLVMAGLSVMLGHLERMA